MSAKEDDFVIENNIIKTTPDIEIERGSGYEIFRSMKIFKNNIAQFLADDDTEDTYGALLTRSVRCALKMRQKGLSKGDIISICSFNHRDTCVPLIAAVFLGIKIAPLDPTLSINDTAHLLKQVTPKRIFFSPDATDLLEATLKRINLQIDLTIFSESKIYEQFSEYLEPNEEEDNFIPEDTESVDETTFIFFSSGTTGLAKGICLSHRSVIYNSFALMYSFGLGTEWAFNKYNFRNRGITTSVTLSYSKLYWISSAVFLYSAIFSGSARIVCTAFNPESIWRLIEKYKATLLFMAPSQGIGMCKAGRPEGVDTTSLLSVILGGSLMSTPYLLQLRDLLPGTFVSQIYGQTENAGVTTCFKMNSPRDSLLLDRNPGSCGRPIKGIWYKIIDLETQELLGPNQKGELRIKSYCQFNGYYNRDSSEAFDEDGWLNTGDIAYYDEDCCFYIVERLKQLIKYRTTHVPPVLVENVLQEHPAVKLAILIGLPHEEDGEHPMAVIKLNKGYEDTDPNELVQFVENRVDDAQRLRAGVRFVDDFPMTPSGKVKRLELKRIIFHN